MMSVLKGGSPDTPYTTGISSNTYPGIACIVIVEKTQLSMVRRDQHRGSRRHNAPSIVTVTKKLAPNRIIP